VVTASPQDRQHIAAAVRAAVAECLGRRFLTLEEALHMARLAREEAEAMRIPVVVSVADASGGLMLVQRMDGALPASVDIAINKAYTAAAFRVPTHVLGEQAQPGQPLYGVQATNQGRVVVFGGGYPCQRDGAVVGAIGVSGGTVEQDMRIASHALRTFQEETGFGPDGGKRDE
jgi:uncharacterized protein GlcG (DUF336 family)